MMNFETLAILLIFTTVCNSLLESRDPLTNIPEDATLELPQFLQKYGYPCETHTVTTEDGYILTLHRIPHGRGGNLNKTRAPVYLQHGLLTSATDWILSGPTKALGLILADADYDVWMGNARGNAYSRRHVFLKPYQSEFWDFTFHEIAIFDLPASIDYVLEQTQQTSLYYIGHSQGGTVFHILCSEKPAYNAKIRFEISMAPAVYLNNMDNPFAQPAVEVLLAREKIQKKTGYTEGFATTVLNPILGQLVCSDGSPLQVLCSTLWFTLFGYTPSQLNTTLFPTILGHTPAGCSMKQIFHFCQFVRSTKFRQWDDGFFENFRKYGTYKPPDYILERITVPVYIFYSKNDFLISVIDINRLIARLPNVKGTILVDDYNHADFIFGLRAPIHLYPMLIEALQKY